MMAGPGSLDDVRKSATRLDTAISTVLAPGENVAATGLGWVAERRRAPLLFLGRRQYWLALTDRRLLVFARRHGGPTADDLILGKRFSFFTLEKVHRHRPLFQIRMRGANDSRFVLEFRPGHRELASELTASLRRALPAATGAPASGAPTTTTASPGTASGTASPTPAGPERDADADTAAAFWGER